MDVEKAATVKRAKVWEVLEEAEVDRILAKANHRFKKVTRSRRLIVEGSSKLGHIKFAGRNRALSKSSKTSEPPKRRETIRVLGLLGALDPYKHKMNLGQIDSQVDSTALLSMSDNKTEAEASHGVAGRYLRVAPAMTPLDSILARAYSDGLLQ
uniref:Serine/threonine-protein kinase mTOR domain-containing protein n=1 Tax=Timema genevievae TaxID=629358 RepID=A0A7R9PI25_TIMGE|nr:unnamed protein product [Timema genevievae]